MMECICNTRRHNPLCSVGFPSSVAGRLPQSPSAYRTVVHLITNPSVLLTSNLLLRLRYRSAGPSAPGALSKAAEEVDFSPFPSSFSFCLSARRCR